MRMCERVIVVILFVCLCTADLEGHIIVTIETGMNVKMMS